MGGTLAGGKFASMAADSDSGDDDRALPLPKGPSSSSLALLVVRRPKSMEAAGSLGRPPKLIGGCIA